MKNKEDTPDCPVHPNCRCWVEEIELDENGKKFTLYENNKPIMSWDAVSGKDGYRSPEH